jgi:hypothetical protein
MSNQKRDEIKTDEKETKRAQAISRLQKEREQTAGDADHGLHEALQEEFHQVWEDTIKPALEQLKVTTEELLERFSEFEDEFRGYLSDRTPDVDVELLEEIYGDRVASKSAQKDKDAKNETSARPD